MACLDMGRDAMYLCRLFFAPPLLFFFLSVDLVFPVRLASPSFGRRT